ncbi:MAG: hypothetical protein WCL07_02260 [bacterium]
MNNTLRSILLLSIGTIVAGVSIFYAGMMKSIGKIGLQGQVGQEMFDRNALAREIASDNWWKCENNFEIEGSILYLFATGKQKVLLGWKLGEDRIKCGAGQIVKGNALTGTYKIVRGAKYWDQSLLNMEKEKLACNFGPKEEYVIKLSKLEELAKGTAKDEIGRINKMIKERVGYEMERCIDRADGQE